MIFSINYNFIAFIFLNLISFGLQSQEIWVEDSNTGEPLEGVLVFNEESGTNTITDNFGKVNLKDFSSKSTVNFNLLGYQSIVLTKPEIMRKRVIKMYSENEILEEVILSVARSQATREKIAEQVGIIDQNEIENQIVMHWLANLNCFSQAADPKISCRWLFSALRTKSCRSLVESRVTPGRRVLKLLGTITKLVNKSD